MTEPPQPWKLRRLPGLLYVVQRDAGDDVPAWAWEAGDFTSVTRTASEVSIITSHPHAAEDPDVAGPYVAFCVDEVLDFVLTGVLATLLQPLEELHISTLALSTYNTDWLLVPSEESDAAAEAWRRAGHTVST